MSKEETKILNGHSGCLVSLYKIGEQQFVRKTSSNISYNDRLAAQMDKQIAFFKSGVPTPKILTSGYDSNGLFYYDMEYICGESLNEYLENMNAADICNIVDKIFNIINPSFCIASVNEAKTINSIFYNKILDIDKKINLIGFRCKQIDESINYLLNYDYCHFVRTKCHGDLTLENIICIDSELYLIDFLDSFYDCWIIDAAKILQDVWCLWHYRCEDSLSANVLVKMGIFSRLIIDKIKLVNNNLIKDVFAVLLLNVLRIFQYQNNNRTELFLAEQLDRILEVLKSNKYD